ncbi:hypothetical protein BN946_scf185038.g3 [Trametes cinnabarina]|uniref:Reverse transcriptase domain-containing protein n=1 Tax=Pycnoporus cinnabarinus TaxID=5643 RepID=A0A060S527_PYCCI|nr:hypothetical protein BN946_scf185038.g3 [Trametes cinnabarina]
MPFGLSNTLAAFQCFVNEVFVDLLDICVVVYLDDILIYSNSLEEHWQHIKEVLQRLQKFKLYARADNCEFHVTFIKYLGYILSSEGLTMVESKGVPWNFDQCCWDSFNALKKTFTSTLILHHWEPDHQITIETDTSDYTITGILLITTESRELHPIVFHSRTLSRAELNYDTHDKELLAIFECFKTWRHYLEGSRTPIDVVTDHKNLEYFSTMKLLTCHQARWSEFLSQFNLVIHFRPGKLGAKLDALTQRWDVYPKEGGSDYSVVNPHNFRPVVMQEQLSASLQATYLWQPVLRASFLMDDEQLQSDIHKALDSDSRDSKLCAALAAAHQGDSRWSRDEKGFLCFNSQIYVPDVLDLRL